MRLCSKCKNTYTDDSLQFCLADGTALSAIKDSGVPTLIINDAATIKPQRIYSTHFSLILITILVFSLCGVSAAVLGIIGYLNRPDANNKNAIISNSRRPVNNRSTNVPSSGKVSVVRKLPAQASSIQVLSLSPSGKLLAILGADKALSIWDVNTGERKQTLQNTSKLFAVSFTSEENLRSLSADGSIRLWNLQTGDSKVIFSAKKAFHSYSLWSDGSMFACDCGKNEVKVFDINTGALKFTGARGDYIWDIALSRDGKFVAAAGGRKGKPIMIWDVETGQLKQQIEEKRAIGGLAFSPDGKYLAMGGNYDGTVTLLSTSTWKVTKTLPKRGSQVTNIKFTDDGRYLLAFINFVGYMFDLNSPTAVEKLEGYAISISDDGKTRATASSNKMVAIWK